jgi:magnesium-transporting ATPase (P-type)
MLELTGKLRNNIRSIRIIHAALLLAMILYVLMAEALTRHDLGDIQVIWFAFLLTALMIVAVAFFVRIQMLKPATETLEEKSDDPRALARYSAGNILSYVFAESVVLFGMALRLIGGTTTQSLPFYVVGISLMLVWWPRRP